MRVSAFPACCPCVGRYAPDYNPDDTNWLIRFQFGELLWAAGESIYTRPLEVDGGNIVDTTDKVKAGQARVR